MWQQIADDLDAFGGRTVVATGGGSGMGISTARMVVNRAGRVIHMSRSLGRLKAAAAELEPLPRLPSSMYNKREGAVRRAFNGIERIKETAQRE
jgi:NADP-dependent 3-hydroxy acid dehydrogenase YdfG